jgi:secreted trypsin-like serine protease
MNTLALFALCLASVSAYNVKPHAVPMKDVPRIPGQKIVGGVEATPHQYPHQVIINVGGSFSCGGSVIREKWVMTAAHCAESAIGQYQLVAGAHVRNAPEADRQQRRTVAKIIIHPGWNRATLANDVALMEVSEAWQLTEFVQPGVLATTRPLDGEIVTPSGYGKTADGIFGPLAEVLMHVDVPVMSVADCRAVYGDIITDNIVCIDGDGGLSTCNGDSGGPLNYMDTIVGVVSFGSSAGCAQGYPAGFSNVPNYVQWINENIPAQ